MMKHSVFILFGLLILQACHSPSSNKKPEPQRAKVDSLSSEKNIVIKTPAKAAPLNGQIFLIRTYRIWEDDPTAKLHQDWLDLYEQDGKYYLDKVDYEIKDGYDECAQIPSKSVVSKRNSLLFLNINTIKPGIVEHVTIKHSEIWPKETVEYNFRNRHVTLRGYGDIKSTEVQRDEEGREKLFHEVANYRLSYQEDGQAKEAIIFNKDSYDQVFMTTLFAGDLDADGQLDFIFSNPSHYEEEAVLLFLSNHGNPLVFEADEQFDC